MSPMMPPMPGQAPEPNADNLVGQAGAPPGQGGAETATNNIRQFHELEQRVLALSAQFPFIAAEARGVAQLLRQAMSKVAAQASQGQEPISPRSFA